MYVDLVAEMSQFGGETSGAAEKKPGDEMALDGGWG